MYHLLYFVHLKSKFKYHIFLLRGISQGKLGGRPCRIQLGKWHKNNTFVDPTTNTQITTHVQAQYNNIPSPPSCEQYNMQHVAYATIGNVTPASAWWTKEPAAVRQNLDVKIARRRQAHTTVTSMPTVHRTKRTCDDVMMSVLLLLLLLSLLLLLLLLPLLLWLAAFVAAIISSERTLVL